jgi:signal transduction histidine kinase
MSETRRKTLALLNRQNAIQQTIIRLSNINLDIQGFWNEFNVVLSDVCNLMEAANGFLAVTDLDDDGLIIKSVANSNVLTFQQNARVSTTVELKQIFRQGIPTVVTNSDVFFKGDVASEIRKLDSLNTFVFIPTSLDIEMYSGMVFFMPIKDALTSNTNIDEELLFLVRVSETASAFYHNCILYNKQKQDIDNQIEWLENMSHQILAPVSGILGQAENLSRSYKTWESNSPQKIDNTLTSLVELAEWTTRMTKNFAWVANDQRIPRELNKRVEEDMVGKLISYARDVQGMARTRGINRVTVDSDSVRQLNGKIEIDNRLFKQAVLNLLDNAVKYSNPKTDILLYAKLDNGIGRINMTNYGIPIFENETEKIFNRNYRSAAAMQRYAVGSGIGLTIARDIIRLHGGDISTSPSMETPQGWKSTFTITLPITGKGNEHE